MIQNFSGARVPDISSSSPLDFFVSMQQSEDSQREWGKGICKTNEDNSAVKAWGGRSEEEVNGGK